MSASVFVQRLLVALFLAAPAIFLVLGERYHSLQQFVFVANILSTSSRDTQLYLDTGSGFNEAESVSAKETTANSKRLQIPEGTYYAFRLDPSTGPGLFEISDVRIESGRGDVIWRWSIDRIIPQHEISSFASRDGRLLVTVPEGSTDPQLLIKLTSPLELSVMSAADQLEFATTAVAICIGSFGFVFGFATLMQQFKFAWGRPRWATAPELIALVSVVAAVVSCYPVIFFGKSFVSPQIFGVPLLYENTPYLPGGSVDAPSEVVHGADVGASPWATQPWSVVESRALMRDHEFPLWNRFNWLGLPLLGQGISMLGDPLHLLPIVGGGSAWSWDLKFVSAKTLFVFASGMIIYDITESLLVSLLVAASSAFIGFFLYRINHPGFFTLCYSPWVLLAWLRLSKLDLGRRFAGWMSVLVVAILAVLASGAIKEAVASLIILNLAGILCFFRTGQHKWSNLRAVGSLALSGLAVSLLTYPVWASFLATLTESTTLSDQPVVETLPLFWSGGILDDLLNYRVSLQFFPTINLFLGFGVIWAFLGFNRLRRDCFFIPLATIAIFNIAIVYGLISPELLKRVPFISSMHSIYARFSYPLIVLLIAMAGYGYKYLLEEKWLNTIHFQYVFATLILFTLVIPPLALNAESVARTVGLEHAQPSSSVTTLAILVLASVAVLVPLIMRGVVQNRRINLVPIVFLLVGLCVLHLRNGMHLRTGFQQLDAAFLNPGPRPDFSVSSVALLSLPPSESGPYRIVGLGSNLFPGFNAALGLESISGPDPLTPRRSRDLLLKLGMQIDWGWVIHFNEESVRQKAAALDFLNVRFVVGSEGASTRLPELPVWIRSDLEIFERPTAWPRAFWVEHLGSYSNLDELTSKILDPSRVPFAMVNQDDLHLLPAELFGATDAPRDVIAASHYKTLSNSTTFELDAPRRGNRGVDGRILRWLRSNCGWRCDAYSADK